MDRQHAGLIACPSSALGSQTRCIDASDVENGKLPHEPTAWRDSHHNDVHEVVCSDAYCSDLHARCARDVPACLNLQVKWAAIGEVGLSFTPARCRGRKRVMDVQAEGLRAMLASREHR